MKLTISHLGRIDGASLEIKPLTVFVGKANTNKTWTAYTLYAMLRALSRSPRLGTGTIGAMHPKCPQLDDAINTVADRTTNLLIHLIDTAGASTTGTGTGTTPGFEPSFTLEVSRNEILDLAKVKSETLDFTFNSDDIGTALAVERDVLSNAAATLQLDTASFTKRGKIKAIVFNWNRQFWSVLGLSPGDQIVYRHAFAISDALNPYHLKQQVSPIVRLLAEAVYDDAMAFPSERKGLGTITGFADIPRKEAFAAGAGLNLAATDYVRFLSQFQRVLKFPAFTSKILTHLEGDVMNGRADFHGNAEPRIFSFTGQIGPTVQMNASASFVRSMAALDMYLRTVPNQDVIVIDEPEMNAHPEAQIKLVELFAMMANQGRRVIVTTHSPYFVDHLNNLMHGASLPAEKRQELAQYLKLKDKDAFISSENAAAYLFGEDGVVKNLISDNAIDVAGFADETDFLSSFLARIVGAECEDEEREHAE